jgi:hypothetical protein
LNSLLFNVSKANRRFAQALGWEKRLMAAILLSHWLQVRTQSRLHHLNITSYPFNQNYEL